MLSSNRESNPIWLQSIIIHHDYIIEESLFQTQPIECTYMKCNVHNSLKFGIIMNFGSNAAKTTYITIQSLVKSILIDITKYGLRNLGFHFSSSKETTQSLAKGSCTGLDSDEIAQKTQHMCAVETCCSTSDRVAVVLGLHVSGRDIVIVFRWQLRSSARYINNLAGH